MIRLIHRTCLLGIRDMGKFYYAVSLGRKTGVFLTWDECRLQVDGFSGARFKKFGTEEAAWDFVEENNGARTSKAPTVSHPKNCMSMLGSYKACKSSLPAPTLSSATNYNATTGSCYKACKSSFPARRQNKRAYSTDVESSAEPRTKRQRKGSTSNGVSNGNLSVYTDGACTHNGYQGARAGFGVYWGEGHPLNYSARLEGKQTNQRAELTAAIKALEQVKEHHNDKSVTLYTDSKYTINCATDWIPRWKQNGWKTSQRTDVLNKPDLVKLDKLNSELDVKWEYVPGHKNIAGNEEADRLAREGAAQPQSQR